MAKEGYFPGKTIFESGTVTGPENQANNFIDESENQTRDYISMDPKVFFSKENLTNLGVPKELVTRINTAMITISNVNNIGNMGEFVERFKTRNDLSRVKYSGEKSVDEIIKVLKKVKLADIL